MRKNPLFEQPRFQPAPAIPLQQDFSILEWLKSSGRLRACSSLETKPLLDDEEPEILGLIDDDEERVDDIDLIDEHEDSD